METHLLYPGEELCTGDEYPALVRFVEGHRQQPLVLFIPGMAHLARIAYGFPQGEEKDFLAYWLHRSGYPFLALSYPLRHRVFGTVHPEFAVRNWGQQAMDIAARFIETRGLSRQAIVLCWSMAGAVAHALNVAAREREIGLDFCVGLAATPPFPILHPGLDCLIQPSAEGLADVAQSFYPAFLASLRQQDQITGHTVISEETYLREFVGSFPVGLAATPLRYQEGRFVWDAQRNLEDTGILDYGGFPLMASITGDSPLDHRHVLTDRGTWGFFITQTLYRNYVLAAGIDLGSLPAARWQRLIELVRKAPEELSVTVTGSHFFFVGAPGARATVEGLERLRSNVSALTDELRRMLEKPGGR
ncbi:MAG: hypothetical protein L0191_15825 [Acidobacteria bacterium]|nr:hypothetical protein [Acidobacteriota bacterium]